MFQLRIKKPTTLTHYNCLLNEIKETDGAYLYQDIIIKNFIASKNVVNKDYRNIIVNIAENMESRFKDLTALPVFSNLTKNIGCEDLAY